MNKIIFMNVVVSTCKVVQLIQSMHSGKHINLNNFIYCLYKDCIESTNVPMWSLMNFNFDSISFSYRAIYPNN